MRRIAFLFIFLLAPALAIGAITGPQKQLPLDKITIDTDNGPVAFTVEMATTPDTQEAGLMFRKTMAPNWGMLFDFHRNVMVSFWMKNTILPLDMLFIRKDGTISSIAPDTTPYSTDSIPAAEPIRAVLEINAGRAAALGILPGEKVHGAIFGKS
ncbi:MAG TPA: DUF192 domain-containing protein [Rhizomicrobium sp.]|jgi:uncharacterized membrane protein (UPF0127 family)|nr:DUF192 domain-containing protein [Rhizomicrobium sp.]